MGLLIGVSVIIQILEIYLIYRRYGVDLRGRIRDSSDAVMMWNSAIFRQSLLLIEEFRERNKEKKDGGYGKDRNDRKEAWNDEKGQIMELIVSK